MRKTWRGAFLMGTPKDMPSKALEMGLCFHTGTFRGTWRDSPFLGPLGEGKNSFI